jgi:hypothetical protein
MPWTSEHTKWLIDTGERLKTADGKEIEVWEFRHEKDEAVLSAWAKHFRNHYCLDTEIDFLRGKQTRTEFSEEDNDVIIPQKWIINLDIDYFFCEIGERKGIQLLSNEYITEFACILKNALQRNRIIGLTIALSPECCGGWKNAESICSIITDKIGLNFKLE